MDEPALKRLMSHSMRIGAASAVGDAPPPQIKALGRWKSRAYKKYCRTLKSTLVSSGRQTAMERAADAGPTALGSPRRQAQSRLKHAIKSAMGGTA